MRDELLNETLFFDLDDAHGKIANWVADYNLKRPHSSLKYLPPAAYAAHLTATDDRLRNPDQLRRSSRCSTRPTWRTNPRDSNCRWMKMQWQVNVRLPAKPAGMTPTQMVCEVVLETLEPLEDEHFKLLKRFARHSSIAQLLEKAHQIGAIPPDHNDALMYERIEQFQRALQLYRAPSLPIEVHQFYATDSFVSCRARLDKSSIAPEMSSPMRGWDRVLSAAAIDTTPIPGNHATMMNTPENRKVLARSLSRALNSSPT